MNFGLIGLLTISVLAGAIIWIRYHRLKQFVARLADDLRFQVEQRQPLEILSVPERAVPLYLAIKSLLRQLPSNIGRDPLTGLPNRQWFKRAITPLMPVTSGTLVMLDIDRFRLVNDLFGFSTGDELLQGYAARLRQSLSQPRLVARMDGDEFILFYEQPLAIEALKGLQLELQQPYLVDKTPIGIKVRVGYLQLEAHHADISLMLKRVDLAVKKARDSRNGIAGYETGDDSLHLREMQIIHGLPKALHNNQLYLVYQPKESLHSGKCKQVEALLRWEHPQLGIVPPAEFIPLAECAGMISLVSHWVLEKVLLQQQQWRANGVEIRVAVNLAGSDFEQDIVTCIERKLQQYQLPGDALALEITEGVLIANTGGTRDKLQQLRQMGIEVAIDDFGTGHSSLAYLKDLPVDEIKIDKAFVDDLLLDCRAEYIMQSTINLAHHLGFRVTVEGVENSSQREALKKMGADLLQGQLFAHPMRAAELVYHSHRLSLGNGLPLTHAIS
ncbi:bifunctional diguanylate cyclase/phosphodiesterase [Shewanella sp. 4t3-1-2LB]|uniref:putative bifunctional diguanylate cyclase/phosphodiesterase n=1 Tax=Shewanella sp. 4t3-1-2LB TaxID=2817682 RepID=UPI001A99DCDC|nr:bifunctional diguanylate cyclase/phosphodiesterase [Shewanella sp. 4t3-1-2LB]MBO1271914.1 bifunctional diguanylate cyclase/phosphodiesterase [Shewanella sp. 4t3-1-2LB]